MKQKIQPNKQEHSPTYTTDFNTSLNDIVIYQTEDGEIRLDVKMDKETVWLTQIQMSELFQTDRTSIVRHINNIYKSQELESESTCAKIAQVTPFDNSPLLYTFFRCLVTMLLSTPNNCAILSCGSQTISLKI